MFQLYFWPCPNIIIYNDKFTAPHYFNNIRGLYLETERELILLQDACTQFQLGMSSTQASTAGRVETGWDEH